MIGLCGPAGAGKTTLVNLICRFYDPTDGQILIDGIDIRDYDVKWLRRQIGVVLQEPYLFHGTIADNIRYGNPDATLEEIIRAAKAANAHDFIVGFPDGYDTIVGERGQSPLRRRAAAHQHRPRHPAQSEDPDPGRGDQLGGYRDREADPGGAGSPGGRADDDRHRPPALARCRRPTG